MHGGRVCDRWEGEEELKKVYVASPYTKGDVAVNVREAILAGNALADLGYAPFIPVLTHFWHLVCPRPYEFWCELDNQFLPHCDAILRVPGESVGADREVALAKSLGIPDFHSVGELHQYFKNAAFIEGKS